MGFRILAVVVLAAFAATVVLASGGAPTAALAATCADHPDQASAQRAKDTRDADGDGRYCVISTR